MAAGLQGPGSVSCFPPLSIVPGGDGEEEPTAEQQQQAIALNSRGMTSHPPRLSPTGATQASTRTHIPTGSQTKAVVPGSCRECGKCALVPDFEISETTDISKQTLETNNRVASF